MEDKEQIIVNGVDVSKCFHYEKENKEYTCRLNHTPFHYRHCEDNPNCYYKQLQRKTNECDELKKEKVEIKKYLGIDSKTILERLEELQERRDELSEKNISYEQALKELKEQLEFLQASSDGDDILIRIYMDKVYRLSKTLDDIEEICRQLLDDDYIRSIAESLIDIIDKAKEGNNE